MNAEKLATMPLQKVRQACVVHAERALFYRETGNRRMFKLHTDLLDQCAAVGRKLNPVLKGKRVRRKTAKQLLRW